VLRRDEPLHEHAAFAQFAVRREQLAPDCFLNAHAWKVRQQAARAPAAQPKYYATSDALNRPGARLFPAD
jgi:hypothetical protein